jgi:hypothetical protein
MVLAPRKFGSGRNSVEQLFTARQHAPGDTKLEISERIRRGITDLDNCVGGQ